MDGRCSRVNNVHHVVIVCSCCSTTLFLVVYLRHTVLVNLHTSRTSVDLAAPGSSILSTSFDGSGYITMSGTSMAAPFVSGAAALLRAAAPTASSDCIRTALLATVDPVPSLASATVTGVGAVTQSTQPLHRLYRAVSTSRGRSSTCKAPRAAPWPTTTRHPSPYRPPHHVRFSFSE